MNFRIVPIAIASVLSLAVLSFHSQAQWKLVNNGLIDTTLHDGDKITVTLSTDCVNVRSGPSTTDSIYECEPAGTSGTLGAGPSIDINGSSTYKFWQVAYSDGIVGWSASEFLTKTNTTPVIVAHAVSGTSLFIGTYGHVYRSTNNGDTWSVASSGFADVRDLAVCGSNLFAATYGWGVFRSTDNGTTWTGVLSSAPTYSLEVSGTNIFAGVGDVPSTGICRSSDGGTNWTRITRPPSSYPYLSVCGADLFIHAHNDTTYRSTDNGTSWIGVCPSGVDYFFGKYLFRVTAGSVTRAPDSSVISWTDINAGLQGFDVQRLFAIDDTYLFAETLQGIFFSTNSGTIWMAIDPNLTFPSHVLAIIGNDIFAVTQSHGVWRRPLSEALPIQLASFVVQSYSSNSMKLTWATVSEINNYGFYVQKSPDKQTWANIGELIHGHGTTLTPQTYNVTLPISNGSWWVRLVQVDLDGTRTLYDAQLIQMDSPVQFTLEQNYPNPFNPSTTIRYGLPVRSNVTLAVFNPLGEQVAVLISGTQEVGNHEVKFDGSSLASGLYFCRLRAGDFVSTKRLLLLK